MDGNNRRASYHATFFDIFGVEHTPKEIKKLIGTKKIITKFIECKDTISIMYGYFFSGFVDFMLRDKNLLDYTNLFSPNDYEKNDEIILNYFQ